MNQLHAYVAIGGNLPLPGIGDPLRVVGAAVQALPDAGVTVLRRSRWYRSAPVPPSDQPEYVNGVLEVDGGPDPWTLLRALQRLEVAFGRVRPGRENAARTLDLDLLAHGERVVDAPPELILPHPRLHVRGFVLVPLAELVPGWEHPRLRRTASDLLRDLAPVEGVHPIAEGWLPPSPEPRPAGLKRGGRRA